MSRSKGTLGISANFEPQIAASFDARANVPTKADLTIASNWTANDGGSYPYNGMTVTVAEDSTSSNNGIYILLDKDNITDINSWQQIGEDFPYTGSAQITGSLGVTGSGDFSKDITVNGNVGIGTTTPSYKLEVSGSALISGSELIFKGSSTDFNIQNDAGSNIARIATTTGGTSRLYLYDYLSNPAGALHFEGTSYEDTGIAIRSGSSSDTLFLISRDVNQNTMQVYGNSYFSGSVGIGTATPSYLLSVGDGETNTFIEKITPSGSIFIGSSNNIRFGFDPGKVNLAFSTGGPNNDVPLAIGTFNSAQHLILGTNNTERMRISGSNGYVGIGTTLPTASLHVNSGVTNKVAVFESTDGNAYIEIKDLTGQMFINKGPSRINLGYVLGDNKDNLTILENGKVGIGEISPVARLDISGSDNENILLIGSPSNPNTLFITGSGKVGIGTTSPTEKLHVNGDTILSGSLYSSRQSSSLTIGYTLIYQVDTGSYTAGFFDYYATSASNGRAGTIMSFWLGSELVFTDNTTTDIGSTTNLAFSMSLSQSYAQLYSSASSDLWAVKTAFRTI